MLCYVILYYIVLYYVLYDTVQHRHLGVASALGAALELAPEDLVPSGGHAHDVIS